MGGPVTITNVLDTYVSSATPNQNFGVATRLFVGGGTSSLLFFANPVPLGANVVSAELHVKTANKVASGAWAGSVTLTTQRVAASWSANRVTYAHNLPVTGATSSVTQSDAVLGTDWNIDITPQIQAVASGGKWFGLKLTATGSTKKALYSSQATHNNQVIENLQPFVVIRWTFAPLPPENLSPRSGLVVSTPKPLLNFNYVDVNTEKHLKAIKLQISTNSAMTAIVYDSGIQLVEESQWDLTPTAFSATAGTVYYWRVQTQDISNLWSAFSQVESFSYRPNPPLTLQNPNPAAPTPFVEETTPPISWAATGQSDYQIVIYDPLNMSVPLWNSGRVTSTDQSVPVKAGTIKTPGKLYRLILRVWTSTYDRIDNANGKSYAQTQIDFLYQYDPTVDAVSSLVVNENTGNPSVEIVVHRATQPDFFTILRNDRVLMERLDPSLYQSVSDPTKYTFLDYPAGRRTMKWEVVSIVNGKTSANNPTVTKLFRRKLSWLITQDQDLSVGFANPKLDTTIGELSSVLQPLKGPALLLTQAYFGESGSFSGRLASGISDFSARTMLENLKTIRKEYGGRATLMTSDEVMDVYIYNLKVDRVNFADGTTEYDVRFDLIEVGNS